MTRAQRGYSLIEVLVAFAVLALALTLLLGTLSNAGRQVRWSDEAGRAAMHARSLLDANTSAVVLATGRSEGVFEDGRYRWVLDIADFRDPDPALQTRRQADPGAARLLQLDLTVRWGEGEDPRRRLHLTSLRLARPQPGATVSLQ